MAEQQTGRHLPGAPTPGSPNKADSKLRLVGTDGQVVIPDDSPPSDCTPTIISKITPKSLAEAITAGDKLDGKHLYGQRVAHFELLESVGVGGMAAVLRARDTLLDRYVALKILPPEMACDEENIRRFHQEARAAAKLDHPNIAQVFFCGSDRGLNFIAFEYVDGDNLRSLVERRGRLPVAEAVRYIIQVAAGLDHASSRGVVHRDIKPSNIIVTANGAAKLVDMGLAHSLERKVDKGLTHSGMTLGTFDYISPEQALEPREADTRSDIYSLGCTFYNILTGQPPVPEGTAAKKLYHHQHLAPIDPRQLNPEIPDEVAAILMRMMCKNPEARYQKPVHLIQHLMQVAEKVGAGADAPAGVMFLDAPLPGTPRIRPLLTITLAGLALGVLLILLTMAPNNSKKTGNNAIDPNQYGADKGNRNPTNPSVTPGLPGDRKNDSVTKPEQLDQFFKQQANQVATLEQPVAWNTAGTSYTVKFKNSLTLRGPPDKLTKLTFHYQPPLGEAASLPCLALDVEPGATVTFENIHFELHYGSAVPEAIIAISGAGRVKFKRCVFTVNGRYERGDKLIASVFLQNDGKTKSQVNYESCYFEHGQAAIVIEGPAKVTADQCAFGLHQAQFLFRGETKEINPQYNSEVTLNHCSAFVVRGPAFRVDDYYYCVLNVNNSIFSNPKDKLSQDDAQLIHQSVIGAQMFRYVGKNNVYHNLRGLFGHPDQFGDQSIEEFNARLEEQKLGEDKSKVLRLAQLPWAESDPLQRLKDSKPAKAFQIKQNMRELRIGNSTKLAVGITQCAWGSQEQLVELPTAPSDGNPQPVFTLGPNDRVFDPDVDVSNKPATTFASLIEAVKDLRNGGVIYIKHGRTSREIQLESVAFERAMDRDLIFKPYPNPVQPYYPILVYMPSKLNQRTLFRHRANNKLVFESLEFLIEPKNSELNAQSIVALNSDGHCSFYNCVFTLKKPDRVFVNLVSFQDVIDDIEDKMPTPAPAILPQVTFSDCFIRGAGDLIAIRSGRALELRIDNSLIALNGSAIALQGNTKDKMVSDLTSRVQLSQVSSFLTKPFIRGKYMEGLVPVRCEAMRHNLFVSFMPSQPFLFLEVAKRDMEYTYVKWMGEKNQYVDYELMFESRIREDFMTDLSLDRKGWETYEKNSQFLDGVFNLPPKMLSYSELHLDHFKPAMAQEGKVAGYGANLDGKSLPPYYLPAALRSDPPEEEF